MRHFREFMGEDIWHLEACLTAAGNNARKLLDLLAPRTEKQIKRHNDLELAFDSQLKHIRAYLNGMWAEDGVGEDSPEAKRPTYTTSMPLDSDYKKIMDLILGVNNAMAAVEDSDYEGADALHYFNEKTEGLFQGLLKHRSATQRDEAGEGPGRIGMPLVIVGPVEKSSFKINTGTALILKHLAKLIIQEVNDYNDEPVMNGSDYLDQMALAFFAFLRAIKKEDPAEG